MTHAINIPNSNGCNLFPREETQWPVFDRNNEYYGQIYKVCAWTIPNGTHKRLGLSNNQLSLFKTPAGQYAKDLCTAEKLARLECSTLPTLAGAAA
jgi:hypothetical protein